MSPNGGLATSSSKKQISLVIYVKEDARFEIRLEAFAVDHAINDRFATPKNLLDVEWRFGDIELKKAALRGRKFAQCRQMTGWRH